MRAEKLLGKLHHHFQAARLLQGSRATDDRNDGQHHGYRRLTRGEAEDKDHEHQTDAGNKTKSDATITSAQKQGTEDDDDLEHDGQN